MSKNKNNSFFTVTSKDGKETEYEILFTFESGDTCKKYMVYTDGEKDSDGYIKTYASIYTEDEDGLLKLSKIEDEKEWNVVEKLLKEAQETTNEDVK